MAETTDYMDAQLDEALGYAERGILLCADWDEATQRDIVKRLKAIRHILHGVKDV